MIHVRILRIALHWRYYNKSLFTIQNQATAFTQRHNHENIVFDNSATVCGVNTFPDEPSKGLKIQKFIFFF